MVGADDRAETLVSWWPGREGELLLQDTLSLDLFHGSSLHLLITPSILNSSMS